MKVDPVSSGMQELYDSVGCALFLKACRIAWIARFWSNRYSNMITQGGCNKEQGS
jgi:hypothetical protein